ncbi:beta-ketoacyl synthase N-terminal-like domain-containing protein [Brevibacillus dissolubilis]|uniref:beta-ketoacyl synthase N-terminal-like domain-containing protein n=1 Tax=Brevibacillus dissolubilis TaxID=1844116 RepID=UPI00111655CB|nr:beta-ketoacyl synthase N-terminal-like domain-containing protein [Brevibacillus dissolubilis]
MERLKNYILEQVANQSLNSKDALQFLQFLNQEAERQPVEPCEQYAIVGMAGRFPDAPNVEAFWKNLTQGKDSIAPYPQSRIDDVTHINQDYFEKMKGAKFRPGGYLERVDLFDPAFFNITPAEAKAMEPNQRFFLEVAWEALENGNYSKEKLKGSRTGVFVGHSMENRYKSLLGNGDPLADIGNMPSMIAARVSYLFNLRGPSMTIDTTCSSSLVAVHTACQALKNNECDTAIAGGVNVGVFPLLDENYRKGHEAGDGRCKAFDASADGTNFGEGAGVIVIRRLSDALKDQDFIYAVIKGSAVNNDGLTNGITAPNPEAQRDVVIDAWKQSRINPETISYIEAHGTGTKLGDPIEIQGLTEAFRKYTTKKKFVAISSVKTNIGHLDAAAGIASLVKAVLCFQHGQLPASLHFHEANPYIDFENSPVYVNDQLQTWERDGSTPRRAGISSFGMSGTNCHLILEEFQTEKPVVPEENHLMMFTLSGKSQRSVLRLAKRYKDFLQDNAFSFTDVVHTANRCREHHEHRIAILVSSLADLRVKLSRVSAIGEIELFPNLSSEGIYYSNLNKKAAVDTQERLRKIQPHENEALLEAYLDGYHMDWEYFYQAKPFNKVPLPSGTYNQVRCWPKLEVAAKAETPLQSLLYDLSWCEYPLGFPQETAMKQGGVWLVFANRKPLTQKLIERLELEGQQALFIYPGEQYKQVSETEYHLNPNSIDDYQQFVSSLEKEMIGQITGVLHMWTCQSSEENLNDPIRLHATQYEGVYSAFYLSKTLLTHKELRPISFTVVTDHVYRVDGSEERIYPEKAPLVGYTKVISQEFPNIATYSIDLNSEGMTQDEMLACIMSELSLDRGYRDELVAYRRSNRYIQMLKRLDMEQVEQSERKVKQNGVYLFAGAGFLGMEAAKYLAKQEKIKIVLLNRTPLPPRERWEDILRVEDENSRLYSQLKGIEEIEKLGSEVLYIPTNLMKENDVKAAIHQVVQQYGKIDGVLFTIKDIYGKTIEEITEAEFTNSIQSKIAGSWLIDHYTKDQALDFFINFASISSVMAGPKNCDCTSANTFLDSFADYRQLQGRKTITLNLTEIYTGERVGKTPERTMIPPMKYEDFISCFAYVLQHDLDYVVISDFDMEVLHVVLPVIKINFEGKLLQEIQRAQINEATLLGKENGMLDSHKPATYTLAEVDNMLAEVWQEVLGYEEIDPYAQFFQLGGTSLSAVKLIRLVSLRFGIAFEVADLYTYASFEAMRDYIHTSIKETTKQDDLFDLLDVLTEDELSVEDALRALEKMET